MFRLHLRSLAEVPQRKKIELESRISNTEIDIPPLPTARLYSQKNGFKIHNLSDAKLAIYYCNEDRWLIKPHKNIFELSDHGLLAQN